MKKINLVLLCLSALTVVCCTKKIELNFTKTFNLGIETTTNVIEDKQYVVSEGDTVTITLTEEGDDVGGTFISADILLDDEVINHFSELPYSYPFEIKDLSVGLHTLKVNILITQLNKRETLTINVGILVK